jgi:hypothetical protein
MKFLKTHYGRAINVIPSNTVNIPNPAGLGVTGVTDGILPNGLQDSTANFTTNLLGSIVVNTTNGTVANVVGFDSSIILLLDEDIFQSGTQSYSIYNSDNNQGCALYIPAQQQNDLTVLTVGGDVIKFKSCGDVGSSMILPVNVLKVFKDGTALTDLVALW